jgi:hypothetical protein
MNESWSLLIKVIVLTLSSVSYEMYNSLSMLRDLDASGGRWIPISYPLQKGETEVRPQDAIERRLCIAVTEGIIGAHRLVLGQLPPYHVFRMQGPCTFHAERPDIEAFVRWQECEEFMRWLM